MSLFKEIWMEFYEMSDGHILKDLGQRVRRRRLNRNMSQEELAKRAGLSRRTIGLLESGCSVGLKVVIRILRVFKSLEDLNLFFPDEDFSPIELAKLKGYKRRRASSSRSKNR